MVKGNTDSQPNENANKKAKKPKITPAMQQFYAAKEQYPDCVIFFRMGDFYETFCEDAEICARELEITLTSRGKNPSGESIPLAGVPYHAVETYLSRMISKGYKVAICEQTEDPKKAKGVVKRDVVRVVTPGTVIDAALIGSDSARYLMAAVQDKKKKRAGLSFLDISTGDFWVYEVSSSKNYEAMSSEIARFSPSECVIPKSSSEEFKAWLRSKLDLVSFFEDEAFSKDVAEKTLKKQFGESIYEQVFDSGQPLFICAAGAALRYAQKTQFNSLEHIKPPKCAEPDLMLLDATTIRNLELVNNIRDGSEKGTLVETVDMTKTPMGKRLIRKQIISPLFSCDEINRRLDSVEFFTSNTSIRQEVRQIFNRFSDIERIAGRISYKNASPRDLVTLSDTLLKAENVCNTIKKNMDILPEMLLSSLKDSFDLLDTADLISRAIIDEPPALLRKGGVIKTGYSPELDEIRSVSYEGKSWITALEQQERENTGIKSLKVKYNGVFGYFIEVTKPNLHLVPERYERKQTTANSERFTIPELREKEAVIATADDRLILLEQELYENLLDSLNEFVPKIQRTAASVAVIDVAAALAESALRYRYVRPDIGNDTSLLIREGRHPVVDPGLLGGFVPNDAELDASGDQILIITGANMAGKSTYMRSVALITLMAQIGSFVPADYAHIGLVDRIFTRVGAFDDLASGQSTFMVEMLEVAAILNSLTDRSLVILDEIGRGTSTLDGYCIAKAVIEFIHGKKRSGARTLFATHFHELVGVEAELKRLKNCHFAVKETDNDVIFLRKLISGATDKSYGIHVANLAGIPEKVTKRAEVLLDDLVSGRDCSKVGVKRYTQMLLIDSSKPAETDPLVDEIALLNVDEMTPVQALNLLSEFSVRAKNQIHK